MIIMKNKVLIIFKYSHGHWNVPVINQFSEYYDTEYLYISDYKNKNFTEIVNDINNLIKLKKIEVVVFDVDYFRFINFFFIEKINGKKKILITGDDFELHELNAITASACDIVLSTCPLSALKYKEKGYEAYVIQFEYDPNNNNVVKNSEKKDIDVLFFGHLTPDRKEFLDYIVNEGISLKNVGHRAHIVGLPQDELIKLISKSKIILNLSKSRTTSVKNYVSENIYKFYYQLKARVIVAGLNNVACVSEYSPGQELLFQGDEVPTFFSKEECVVILKKLLNNDELLEKYRNKFNLKVKEICDFKPIYNLIEKLDHRKVKLVRFPYWYLRIVAKQILLKNLKLSTFIKTIFQFNIIFSIIKNSNFIVKFLVILESIVNTLWYSFILTIKPKK